MKDSSVISLVRSHPRLKARLAKALNAVGYDTTDWLRVVMYKHCFEFIRNLGPENLEVMEISAGPHWVREFKFASYTKTEYPEFDICSHSLSLTYDLIIADQVFEHLKWPYRAGRNVFKMINPDGYLLISVPFLVRVHKSPVDCSRWTEDGLFYFLQECGFPEAGIRTQSWGNRACLRANLSTWRKRGFFGSLANEADFPVMVWAFAQKLVEPAISTALATGSPIRSPEWSREGSPEWSREVRTVPN